MRRDWKFIGAITLLTALAIARVATTYRLYGQTIDEPVHLAAGWQWLTSRYTMDLGHPPLVRALCALPLLLSGYPASASEDAIQRGNDLLYSRDRYETTLSLARSANVLMLVVAIVGTALWARRTYSLSVAILAVAIFTSLPPVLGHAGLITNDLGAAATLVLALLALEWYLDAPSLARAALTGLAVAIGVLTKFSFLVFFPPSALILLIFRMRLRWRDAGVATLVTMFVLWGGYKFDFGTAKELSKDGMFLFEYAAPKPFRPFTRRLAEVPLPAPALSLGLATLAFHNQQGHDAYLFGGVRREGWWYYFPVVFFYKTPIPFLLLAGWGAAFARKQAAVALAVLLVAMTASINIGVRHILPMYAPLSIVVAVAIATIWSRATSLFSRGALVALLVWLFGGIALSGRDMLPWFNEVAQPNPASIAVDSNLDWGQDTLRLAGAVRELHIDKLHSAIFTNARLDQHGIRAVPLDPYVKTSGWVAVSEMMIAMGRPKGEYTWLNAYRPVRRIGSSIRLYSIP
ncbi:MAG: hypothetical protein ACXW5U_09855 [Thermoanaerobaculia bacterium]